MLARPRCGVARPTAGWRCRERSKINTRNGSERAPDMTSHKQRRCAFAPREVFTVTSRFSARIAFPITTKQHSLDVRKEKKRSLTTMAQLLGNTKTRDIVHKPAFQSFLLSKRMRHIVKANNGTSLVPPRLCPRF